MICQISILFDMGLELRISYEHRKFTSRLETK